MLMLVAEVLSLILSATDGREGAAVDGPAEVLPLMSMSPPTVVRRAHVDDR